MSTQRSPFYDDIPQGFTEADGVHAQTYQERDQADAETLKSRGFTSDFCGAWTSLWAHIAREYGPALEAESVRVRARKGLPGESCAEILEQARSVYMGVMGAAVRIDKFNPKLRRFKVSAFYLECTRRGVAVDLKPLSAGEKRAIIRNLGRSWRKHWAYVALVQRVIGLPLVERERKTFVDCQGKPGEGHYTDRLSDLIGSIITVKNNARGKRLPRFESGVATALGAFRKECAHFCRDGKTGDGRVCQRPHLIVPPEIGDSPKDGNPEDDNPATGAEPAAPKKPRKKILPFRLAVEKLADGVDIILERSARGLLSPEEAEQAVMLFAPVVALIAGTNRNPPMEDGEPYADFTTEASPDESALDAEFVARASDTECDFAEQNAEVEKRYADPEVRVNSAATDSAAESVDDFLAGFFPDPYEEINLRALKPKGAPDGDPRFAARKWSTCREALACDAKLLAELHEVNRTRGIYFVVNSGGDKAKHITRVNAFFAEIDDLPIAEQHAKFDASPLAPPTRLETLQSVHSYYLAARGVTLDEFDDVQRGLIHFYGSDPKIKDRSRVMRLPFFNHVSYNAGLLSYKPVTIAAFDPSRRFTAAEMLAAFPAAPDAKPKQQYEPKALSELSGDFEDYKRELSRRICSHSTAKRNSRGNWDCRGLCHNGKGATGIFYDPAQNFVWCTAKCDLATIARAFGLQPYGEVRVGGAA